MDQMSLFNTVQTLVVQTFYWSVKTGKVLVYIMKFLLENTIRAFQEGANLTLAIIDSLQQFSKDWLHILLGLWDFVERLGSWCFKICLALVYGFEKVVSLLLALNSGINRVVTLIWDLLITAMIKFKSLLVLFGSGVWFALTFVPNLVVCLTSNVFHYICNFKTSMSNIVVNSTYNTRTSVSTFYQFITDVPLESLVGIFLAICIIYIFTEFYLVIFSYFRRQTRRVVSKIYRKVIGLKSRLSTSQRRPTTTPQLRPKPRMSSDERYCIICTECLKCVVLLPCRHLCLCTECSEKVRRQNNSCPICRCYIEDRIKVFM